jgi:hypothetical protein
MDAVEMNRVRVRAGVREPDPEQIVLGGADHRPRHGGVVRPGGEEDALGDLDLAVDRRQRVLAHPPRLVRKRLRRIEQCGQIAGAAGRGDLAADHRRMRRRVRRHTGVEVWWGRLGRLRHGQLRERRRRHRGRGRQQQLPARYTPVFRHV